jgi:hypothetical protein
VGVSIGDDQKSLYILFDKYQTEANALENDLNIKKSCDVAIEIIPPKNHAIGVYNQMLRGYAYLENDKSHGSFASKFRFKHHPENINLQNEFFMHGPYDNSFEFHNKTPLLWSPCSSQTPTTLIASTQLTSAASIGGFSYMALDSQDAALGIAIDLDFIPCESMPPPEPPVVVYPPLGPDEIICESVDFKYNSCRIDGKVEDVQLVKLLSISACTMGDTFGFFSDRIWVDRGCRGIFKIKKVPNIPAPPSPVHELRCESHAYQFNFCPFARIHSAVLVTKHSNSNCEEGKSWGVDLGKGLWVNHGCRATFHITHNPQEPQTGLGRFEDLICESHNMGYQVCSTSIPTLNVEILAQFSQSSCVKNQDFGILNSGSIWVKNGCRGRFRAYDF